MADAKMVRITLVKSPIGFNKKQKLIVRTLGLTKMHASREVALTPPMQGMINKVIHMLHVEEIAE